MKKAGVSNRAGFILRDYQAISASFSAHIPEKSI
jgi:hypothetical protein